MTDSHTDLKSSGVLPQTQQHRLGKKCSTAGALPDHRLRPDLFGYTATFRQHVVAGLAAAAEAELLVSQWRARPVVTLQCWKASWPSSRRKTGDYGSYAQPYPIR